MLVRRLALGRLPAGASSQSLALRLERAFVQQRSHAVHGAGDAAAGAAAVWFGDTLEAHLALALRLVRGQAVDHWYWPLAVAGFDARQAPRAALRRVLGSLAAQPAAAVAVPAWIAALAAAGHLHSVAAAIEAADVPGLRQALGRREGPSPRPRAASAGSGFESGNPPGFRDDSPRTGRSGRTPPSRQDATAAGAPAVWRLLRELLATSAATVASPGRAAPLAPTRAPASTTASAAAAHRAPGAAGAQGAPAPVPGATVPTPVQKVPSAARPLAAARRGDPPPADAELAPRGLGSADLAASQPGNAEALPDPTAAAGPDGLPTQAGGLPLLIPLLQRLGFGAGAAQDEAADNPARLVQRLWALLLRRLDVASDDAAWRLCASLARSAGPQRPTGAEDEADRQAAVWLARCRRWLRLQAGIGPSTLVLRPALLSLGPTHIDVLYDLAHSDLRVRRAGLDIDPGWVPWLGRVVAFRYERGAGSERR